MHTQIRSTIHGMRIVISLLLGSALLFVGLGSGEAAQLPTLPLTLIDTTYSPPSGTTRIVSNSAQFTTALNSAVPGDTIVLTAGNTFTGPFTLPNKSGSGWIYIQSSAYASLPVPGTRVTPANAASMPKITVGTGAGSAIETNAQAHHYRFVGIEFKPVANNYVNTLVSIGTGETSLASLPHDITFDRCYIHGDPTAGGRRGIAMNGNAIAVIDSYISDFKEDGADTQAVWSYNGAGPFKIVNNYLEAAGENVMFGGAEPTITNLVPSDIEIKRNHFFKPLAWITQPWSVKNLLEFKNARRVLVEGNVLENNWLNAQLGIAIQLTPRNEDGNAPWSAAQDITIRLNKIINVGGVINISGRDTNFTSQITRRVLLENNLFTVTRLQGADARIFQVLNGPTDITIRHNTGLITVSGGTTAFSENSPVADQFDFRDNIFSRGGFGFGGTGSGEGTPTLNTYYTNYVFTKNAIISAPSGSYPANNFFPATTAAVQFVDFAGGNYRLSASSPFKNAATDGKDLGADIDAIDAAIGGTGPAPRIAPPTNLRVIN